MKKQKAALLCALTMTAGLCCAAVGAERGTIRTVYDAGMALMFDTSNVTLSMDLSVKRDGEVFKTVSGTYVQSGMDDAVTAYFTTVRPDGTSYDSSWHVTGIDGTACSVDSLGSGYYSESAFPAESSILSRSISVYSILDFASPVMDMVDLLSPGAAVREADGDGERIRVRFGGDEAPEALNTLTENLICFAARHYMGLDLEGYRIEREMAEETPMEPEVLWDDVDAVFAAGYERLYGVPFDGETFYADEWTDEKEAQANAVWDYWDEIRLAAAEGHTDGYVCIFSDRPAEWHSTYEEALLAGDRRMVLHEDMDQSFLHWLREKTGDEWTMDTLRAVWWGSNWELQEAVSALYEEMDQSYTEALGSSAIGYVHSDGTLEIVSDLDSVYERMQVNDRSVAYTSLTQMDSVRVGSSDLTFALDAQGRLTGAEGEVNLTFVSADGEEHLITLEVSCRASDYGTSAVEPFDPEKWNAVSWSEWYESFSGEEEDAPAIESVILNGQEYLVDP